MALLNKFVSATGISGLDGNSYATAYTFGEMVGQMNSGLASGRLYNVFADGVYTRPATDTIATGGVIAAPVFIRGCRVVTGDGYLGRDTNGVLLTGNMPTINYAASARMNITAGWVFLESINVSGSTSSPLIAIGTDSAISRSRAVNSNVGGSAGALSAAGSRGVIFDNDAIMLGNGGLYAISVGSTAARAISNRATVMTTGTQSVIVAISSSVVAKNIVIGGGGKGIVCNNVSASATILDNTIINCSDAISVITGATSLAVIVNNLSTDNSGYGIQSSGAPVWGATTRLRDNLSGAFINSSEILSNSKYGNVLGDFGGPETDYIDFANRNLKLQTTSPAAGSGIPYPASIGAYQFGPSAGGETSYSF